MADSVGAGVVLDDGEPVDADVTVGDSVDIEEPVGVAVLVGAAVVLGDGDSVAGDVMVGVAVSVDAGVVL